MQYFSRPVIPGGYSRGVSLQESSSPWLVSLAALAKKTLEHVKNECTHRSVQAPAFCLVPLKFSSGKSPVKQGKIQGHWGKSELTRQLKTLDFWDELKAGTHHELPLWKGSNSMVLQIKLAMQLSVRVVQWQGLCLGSLPSLADWSLNLSKAISSVWHEVHNQGSQMPPVTLRANQIGLAIYIWW